ncbi:MAG: hypothetical protein EBT57_05790 [Verrucomicrobia bacterium]|nr:hypothetical protein [Verrucomicrobiota bacterium]
MRNSYLIKNLGPTLLHDHSFRPRTGDWNARFDGLVFWVTLLGLLSCIGYGIAHAESVGSDPLVMKIYPDGTKVVLRWSEVGKSVDNGEKFGGAPRIVAYDPAKDGIVPIGEVPQTSKAVSPNSAIPAASSVVNPAEPQKMDYSKSNPDNYDEYGPKEGFGLRTDVGVAFQQSLSGRADGTYITSTFQPGIRFDIEPFYNITDWFAIGVEAAFVHNTIQSISVDGTKLYRGNPNFGNGDLYQVPILLNTRFQFPSEGPVRGFVGGGIGGNWNFLNIASGGEASNTSFQWNYAFELSAGLCYTISPGFDFNTSFKTLCTPNPLGEAQNGQMKASYNYAAEVGLAWRF